jgi:nucleoside-diphosphate-sugar epimerase
VVARSLAAAGHAVSGLARSERSSALLSLGGITPVPGDLAETRGLAALTREFDAIVWAATANREELDAPAVDAMLAALAGTSRTFLYTSGTWVHGNTLGIGDETSPLVPTELVAFRAEVERRVLETPGIRGIVLRPGIVYGRGGGIPSLMTSSVRTHGAARYVGTGENHWATVYIDDLAGLYVRALEHAASNVFIGVQGASFSVAEIARAASLGMGAAGRTLAWPLESARRELGAFADALALDQRFVSARAERLLRVKIQAARRSLS